MEEGCVLTLTRPYVTPPKIVVPPRNLNGSFAHGGLNSATPTPLAFFSSLFADRDSCRGSKRLTYLLDEGLASPAFSPTAFYNNIMSVSSNNTRMDMQAYDITDEKAEVVGSDVKSPMDDVSYSKSSAAYKAMMPSRLPITSPSGQFTIAAGISPNSLLESPILFSTRQADPSPTTGALSLQHNAFEVESHKNVIMGKDRCDVNESDGSFIYQDINLSDNSFIFKPHPIAAECGSPLNIAIGASAMYVEREEDGHSQPQEREGLICSQMLASLPREELSSDIATGTMEAQDFFESETMIPLALKASGLSFNSNGRLSIDGYNWKKYGQKQLKSSENPRSYYKCTHPFCPVKRQVELSQEGEITEIKYKGDHNHPKPQGTRRGARSGSLIMHDPEVDPHDTTFQNSTALMKMGHDKAPGESSSLPDLLQDGLPGTPELSFTSPSYEEDDNGEASIACDEIDNEHDSKRRRMEDGLEKPLRTIREPKVVVQTVSNIDIIDDGYRWRKYGQKVVKGHCYPRNYYRCTSHGCAVKKLVERSYFDAKTVITTYEGKHNHGVPVARTASRATNYAVDLQLVASSSTVNA